LAPDHPDAKKFEQGKQVAKEGLKGFLAMGTLLFVMIGSCGLAIGGVPLLLAGIGVLKRRQWGRVLTLILGPLAVAGAGDFAYEHWPLNRYGWIFVGALVAYGLITFIVLLIPRCAQEFE